MCGIFAALSIGRKNVCREAMQSAVASLSHRGPDACRIASGNGVAVGHARLSIIDLSGGQQPLALKESKLWLVCNGEIYNSPQLRIELEAKGHKFRTRSDNEVILHLYREDPEGFVAKLEGMFAFVLLDLERQQILAARDRLGIKPLFIHRSSKHLLLSSEIKAFFAFEEVHTQPDISKITETLTLGYCMPGETCFKGILNLLPGSILKADLNKGTYSTRPYWCPEKAIANGTGKAKKDHLFEALENSVKSHLMGEVGHAIYLSGGIDSSVIAYFAANHSPDQKTKALTLHFDEQQFNEAHQAKSFARKLHIDCSLIKEQVWTIQDLEHVIYHLEAPQIVTLDLSMQQLSANVRNIGSKFVLTGDGADELLGGYDHFGLCGARLFSDRYISNPKIQERALNQALSWFGYPKDAHQTLIHPSTNYTSSSHIENLSLPWSPIWFANAGIVEKLMPGKTQTVIGTDGTIAKLLDTIGRDLAELPSIHQSIAFELRTRLPSWILSRSDRNSMANGIEARVPFLDNNVIDTVFNLPAEELNVLMSPKSLLRQAFRKHIPAQTLTRRKRAFNTPHGWLFTGERYALEELLFGRDAILSDCIEPKALRTLLDTTMQSYISGHQPNKMLSVLGAQTLIGVATTEILFRIDWKKRISTAREACGSIEEIVLN